MPFSVFADMRNDNNDTGIISGCGNLCGGVKTTAGKRAFFFGFNSVGSGSRRYFLGGTDAGRI